jgi:cytochrome b
MRQLYLPMRVWDLPTRLFHWILVVLIGFSWLSESLDWMRLHVISGMTIFSLLLFRLIWGLIGSDSARFSHFLKSPMAALHNLAQLRQREPDTETGHNAAGGWMVLGMLVLLAIQVGTGLCSNDDVLTEGPLARLVGKETSDWMGHIHSLNFTLIQIVVGLHVLAIITYRVLKGHNLLTPMITGKKRLPGATPAPRMMHAGVALVAWLIAVGAIWLCNWSLGYSL